MKTKKIIAGKYEIEGLNRLYTIEKDDFQNTWDVFSGDTIVGNYIDTATTKKMAIMLAVDHSRKHPTECAEQIKTADTLAPDHEFSVGEVMRLRWGI
jgi:hypothetical protein